MVYNSGSASQDGSDDDDGDEVGGDNRLLGFMFGNIDDSGDLDADYLDEDTKEHLTVMAGKLGLSLEEIDPSVISPRTPADVAEQDYDEKAEDAVDYEDIDEQYEGPEIQAASEEDYLLPKEEYFSSKVSVATLEYTAPLFDDENYDGDDDEFEKEHEVVDNSSEAQTISSGQQDVYLAEAPKSPEDGLELGSLEAENLAFDWTNFQQVEREVLEDPFDDNSTLLPVLCVEDGMAILRFSEIFSVHQPLKKARRGEVRRKSRKYSVPKEKCKYMDASDIVEEDEEVVLKGSFHGSSVLKQGHIFQDDMSVFKDDDSKSTRFGVVQGAAAMILHADEERKDPCISLEPVKEGTLVDLPVEWQSPMSPKFYPLDQHDWEDRIIWDNSPASSDNSAESYKISGLDFEDLVDRETDFETWPQNLQSEHHMGSDEEHSFVLCNSPLTLESFDTRNCSRPMNLPFSGIRYHPQLLRLESRLEVDNSYHSDSKKSNATEELHESESVRRLRKLTLQNRDIIEGSWLNKVIWEPHKPIARPKLILDLQDEQMLFEILDNKDGKRFQLHAGAMIIPRSLKPSTGDYLELPGHGGQCDGHFDIANDNFYPNRKSCQQLTSHSEKRTAHDIEVLHSMPAVRLQTMKVKLSNKDIANFHRPKVLWYPHDNKMAIKEQGKLSAQGPMKIILKSLGGKGSKLHVDAEETVSSVKERASKKLDFKPPETVKIFYSGKELEDHKSLVAQNVQPNSLLHLIRTKIHLFPRAQKLPGENRSLRPPGAFKKKSDLSAKDGHVFLMEYCEQRPLLLGNVGMGARLCTYYQKSSPSDQTGTMLRNGNSSLGSVFILDPDDKSPFIGDIQSGCTQLSLETNMYRAPIFPHKVSSTDYLLVRSAKGKLSIRRIDRIDAVGQQEPHMEVMCPKTKNIQTYISDRLSVYMCREFRAAEKRGLHPCIRVDELSAQFPNKAEVRRTAKKYAELERRSNGLFWVRHCSHIPSEEELRRKVTPENVCAYESMQAGWYRLKHLGITRMTHPVSLSAMNQLPNEAIVLAAASHIERELQITPWNLSGNFVKNKQSIGRLEIFGVGDPSGRGLGFSYVKAPISNATAKKKTAAGRGSSIVTGTDSDLRRLSMEAAREVLLKFNIPEEQIAKRTRWHRIALIRKLSSEQTASGLKVDPTTIGKFARSQRMSFLQLQQQTREKCQEIWDRQVQSLSAFDGEENEIDSEANSDLDSFAGDLENLLEEEECEGEKGDGESKHDKEGVKGLQMRRHPSHAQTEEDVEDELAEAAELYRILVSDDVAKNKKKLSRAVEEERGLAPVLKLSFGFENAERVKKTSIFQPDGSFTLKENIIRDPKEVIKGKKSARERFFCGACGQLGHMRTNKYCPKYGKDLEARVETTDLDKLSEKNKSLDHSSQPQLKTLLKTIPKSTIKNSLADAIESEKSGTKAKIFKFKCGSSDKLPDKVMSGTTQSSDQPVVSDAETGNKSVKVKKIVISNKMKLEDAQVESQTPTCTDINQVDSQKPSVVIRPLTDTDREQIKSCKPSIMPQPPMGTDSEVPRKKIVIKRPKKIIDLDQVCEDESTDLEYMNTKRVAELSCIVKPRKLESKQLTEESARKKARVDRQWWEEEEKMREERTRRVYKEENGMLDEQERLDDLRICEQAIRREREEEERQKANKKKKKKDEMRNEYFEDYGQRMNHRRMPKRDRAAKRKTFELERYGAEYTPATKRRRGGEVGLANILERIVDKLRDCYDVSYLFLKPVSKKEAPDYQDIIEHPMDLSTIKEKVRKMEYKSREDFRHDVWQITFNAHRYNDWRNPGIPPLADQLLGICDKLLNVNDMALTEAEDSIEFRDA